MNILRKSALLIKEIGFRDLFAYLEYAFQLRSGIIRLRTPQRKTSAISKNGLNLIPIPTPLNLVEWKQNTTMPSPTELLNDANLLLRGMYRPFRGEIERLVLDPGSDMHRHWSKSHTAEDIKLTWEPARFNWSLDLARAYIAKKNESYAQMYWHFFEEFLNLNPPNSGPNWSSGQEVALRGIMWLLCDSAFRFSPHSTPERLQLLTNAIRQHAERIEPTMAYARSQHNNHILSESLGLIMTGEYLGPADPRSQTWIHKGIREFNQAVLDQVDENGSYAQHSANYQRMLLQLALLYSIVLKKRGENMPPEVFRKLGLATRWLIDQLDTTSGRLPNLGHNDGTLLLPFGCAEYRDYRPTAQACTLTFLGHSFLPPGHWNELPDWLGIKTDAPPQQSLASPAVHKVGNSSTWGSLRGVHYRSRPAHADQLHVELWWQGINLARDAGTFLYNAAPPWQNSLDSTRVHNTVTVNNHDQMERISRFLWLNQAQARWQADENPNCVTAYHNGYRRLDITHKRSLGFDSPGRFIVRDELINTKKNTTNSYHIHWLLPDWEWHLDELGLRLLHEYRTIQIEVSAEVEGPQQVILPSDVSIIRAGKALVGSRNEEIMGWESDTYNEKHPALSFSVCYSTAGSLTITTKWTLTDDKS